MKQFQILSPFSDHEFRRTVDVVPVEEDKSKLYLKFIAYYLMDEKGSIKINRYDPEFFENPGFLTFKFSFNNFVSIFKKVTN